jgi:hypothetical protein
VGGLLDHVYKPHAKCKKTRLEAMYIPVFRVPQLVTEHKQASKMKVNQIECTNKTYRPPKLLISGQTSTEHKFLKGKP